MALHTSYGIVQGFVAEMGVLYYRPRLIETKYKENKVWPLPNEAIPIMIEVNHNTIGR